ncbi:MAG: ATP-dependent DNA helicase, partial [Bacilli bacterium]|nr:ATP-dependent DNA helicase [Bacilli bacterium]
DNFIDFHFEVNKFLKIYDIIDDEYIQYIAFENENDLSLKIYCLDPSKQLGKTLRMFKGTTIFSATLSPIEYYVDLLGGYNDDPKLVLDSPFPKDNLLIMVQPNISTLYSKRENSYNDIALSIQAAIANKIGNYFVFFPSYLYLEKVLNAFSQINILDVNILYQSKSMSDEDKNKFLDRFKKNPSKTTIGFVVLGGVFSEGIDLIEDRLIGAIIVGVGLPQICFEREVIKDYYAKKNLNGFNYAYVNTGINKVMQAAGRVIRSETDRGIVLFIDDRYLHSNYQKIFKGSFRNYQVVYNNIEINNKTTQFWKK